MDLSLIALIVMVTLQATLINAVPQGVPTGGCPCSGFKTTNWNGNYVGECHSVDNSGYYFCYINRGCRNCEGASLTFPNKCKSYANCRMSGKVNPQGSENNIIDI